MNAIIDHPRYGERTTFATLVEAQQAIRDCGPQFAGMTLDAISDTDGESIYDDRGEVVGCFSTED